MSNACLDRFGRILMNNVRDESIKKFDMIVHGRLLSAQGEKSHETLSTLPVEVQAALRDVVISCIDDVLHNFLCMFDGSEEIRLMMTEPEGDLVDLAKESDGLHGEPYGDRGWINNFSEFKVNY